MIGFLLRAIATAFGLWLASRIVPGIGFSNTGTLLVAAVLLGLVNAVVRPVLVLLSLPFLLLTLGLFLLVINALMLGLVAGLLPGFTVQGAGAAIVGSVVVSLASWAAALILRPKR